MLVSSLHNVCKKGFSIAIVSTNVETNNPEKELEPAFDMIGPVLEKFFTVSFVHRFRFLTFMFPQMMVLKIMYSYQIHLMLLHIMNLKPYKFCKPSKELRVRS